MEYLDFNDMLDRAIEKYSIKVPKGKGEHKFRDKTKKKLIKISKEYPNPGEDSFFARAVSNGGKTSPRFFRRRDADQIIMIAEDYFSKFSSDPHIRDLNKEYREKAAEMRAEVEHRPSAKQLEEEREADRRNINAALRSAFEYETGKKPEEASVQSIDGYGVWNEYEEFVNRNASAIESDYYAEKNGEYSYTEYEDPVPASTEDIKRFLSDRRYGVARMSDPSDKYKPEVITEVFERPEADPGPTVEKMKRELLLDALFDFFFNPIDIDALKNDMFVAEDPEDVHWDALYFMCKERLANYYNYTSKKEPIAEKVDMLSAKIADLEERISEFTASGSSSSSASEPAQTSGNIGSLKEQIGAMARTLIQLKDSIDTLTKK